MEEPKSSVETIIRMLRCDDTQLLALELLDQLEDIDLYNAELKQLFVPLGPGSLKYKYAAYTTGNVYLDVETGAKVDRVRVRMLKVGAITGHQFLYGK